MLNMHRVAVPRFYKAESFPEQKHRKMRRSILDPYLPYLEGRVQEGCHNSAQLWQEIVSQGYQGSQSQVSKWMTWRRRQPNRELQAYLSANSITPIYHLPSARILAQILFSQPEALHNDNVWLLGRLIKIPEINTLYDFIQRFIMVKERKWEYLDGWLHDCHFSSLPAFKRFAQSITQDYEAVRAALLYEWSNGQTEGQINRLKYLKRQMYGRANLDLLKLRVMYSP